VVFREPGIPVLEQRNGVQRHPGHAYEIYAHSVAYQGFRGPPQSLVVDLKDPRARGDDSDGDAGASEISVDVIVGELGCR